MAKRIQLSRTKGWRMPPNTIKVDRSTRWGNPFDWREWRENCPEGVVLQHALDVDHRPTRPAHPGAHHHPPRPSRGSPRQH